MACFFFVFFPKNKLQDILWHLIQSRFLLFYYPPSSDIFARVQFYSAGDVHQ